MFKTSAHSLTSLRKASPFLFCSHNQILLLILRLPFELVGNCESQNQKATKNVTHLL